MIRQNNIYQNYILKPDGGDLRLTLRSFFLILKKNPIKTYIARALDKRVYLVIIRDNFC